MPRGGVRAHSTEIPSGGRPLPPTLPWELEDGGEKLAGGRGLPGEPTPAGQESDPCRGRPDPEWPCPHPGRSRLSLMSHRDGNPKTAAGLQKGHHVGRGDGERRRPAGGPHARDPGREGVTDREPVWLMVRVRATGAHRGVADDADSTVCGPAKRHRQGPWHVQGAERGVTLDGQLRKVCASRPPCCPQVPPPGEGFLGVGPHGSGPHWTSGPIFPSSPLAETPAPGPGASPKCWGLFPPKSLGVPLEARDGRWELGGGLARTPHPFPGWAMAGSGKSHGFGGQRPHSQCGPGCVITRTWPCGDMEPRSRHSHAAPSSQEGTVARLWALWGGQQGPRAPRGTLA